MELDKILRELGSLEDYLGPAAICGEESRKAIERKDYDLAWAKIIEAKELYMKHSKQEGFTLQQTNALVGSLDRSLAKICQLEEQHTQALVHIIYCSACNELAGKKLILEVRPYFNRCKFKKTILDVALDLATTQIKSPNFRTIQNVVSGWV